MEIPRQYYTEEFKQEAVKLVRESGLSIAEAGRRLNVPAMTLKNWVYRNKISKGGTVKWCRFLRLVYTVVAAPFISATVSDRARANGWGSQTIRRDSVLAHRE